MNKAKINIRLLNNPTRDQEFCDITEDFCHALFHSILSFHYSTKDILYQTITQSNLYALPSLCNTTKLTFNPFISNNSNKQVIKMQDTCAFTRQYGIYFQE